MKKSVLSINRKAVFEATGLLGALVLLSWAIGDVNRFLYLHPHPFWAVILLISCQYGTLEGLAASGLASLFLYVGNLPEQTADQTLFFYELSLSKLPFLWFVTAFVLGEIRGKLERENDQHKEQLKEAKKKFLTMIASYQSVKEINESLESRIVSEQRTFVEVYNVLKDVENHPVGHIFFEIERIVRLGMHPQKFSIFAFGRQGFEVVTSHGWENENTYPRRYYLETPLCDYLLHHRAPLCAVNPEHATLLGNDGVLAGPLIDQDTGEVFGMLKIEEVPLEQVVAGSDYGFQALCDWIGFVYSHAKKAKKRARSQVE